MRTKALEYIKDLKSRIATLSPDDIQKEIESISQKRIAEIRNTKTEVEIKGTSYYVSNDGNDENDGKSPEKAWKTIERACKEENLTSGDGIFFRRGDLFRGILKTDKEGITLSAYGEGEKPVLTTSLRNSADPDMWIETDVPGVYEYYEINKDCDIGAIIFDDKFTPRKIYRSYEEDGTQLDFRAGRVFNDYHDFVDDMTFFHDRYDTGKIYICSKKGNPATLAKDIELSRRGAVIYARNHTTIDNLCLAWTCFGSSSGDSKGLTVQNCELKWIGGSIQVELGANKKSMGDRTWPTPFGNGVEIYGEAVDFTCCNNYFRQQYDAAVTHQCGRGEKPINNRNVRYYDNVMEHCVYSIEIFYGESPLDNRSNNDTIIEGNIMRMGGGFGHYARPDEEVTALIRHGAVMKNTNDYVIRDNIFDRSKTRLVIAFNDGGSKARYCDNIFVQNKGGKYMMKCGNDFVYNEDIAEQVAPTNTETGSSYIFVEELGY
ncbi:MAG: hypothetical protein E7583_01020 [Ruminococcaceae bacterium]|nr:hypothetical protein [Oscillospiraceae bacterium]